MSYKSASTFFILTLLNLQLILSARPKTTELPKVRSRFKAIRCSADNATVFIKFCYLKAISKYIVTANAGLTIIEPLTEFNAQFILNYRYGLVFRPVIDSKPQDWCAIMKGATPNPYIKLILDILKDTASYALHECPYVGEFEVKNVTFNYGRIDPTAIFPEGTYRMKLILFRGKAETCRLELDEEVKSPIKETFG